MHNLLLLLLPLLSLAACGDKDDTSSEEADTDTDTDADTDTDTDTDDTIEGVEGTVLLSGGGTATLVDGRAFSDAGEGGALKVVLTSFSVGCAQVEDGLGFNTPAGGAFVSFYPLGDDKARLYEGDGTQTDMTEQYAFTAEVSEEGGEAQGTLSLEDGGAAGSATFRVEHCGSMDPFGS